MLVLTRKPMQQVHIGDNITITVVKVDRNSVRVSIEAPRDVRILRGELPRFDEAPEKGEATTDETCSVPLAGGNESGSEAVAGTVNDRRSRAVRRSMPLVDRQDPSVPRAPSHPLRWTMASMRQRATAAQGIAAQGIAAQGIAAGDATSQAADSR